MKKKITYDGESCTLAKTDFDVPLREVRKQIRMNIGQAIRSFKELDGVMRDENATYEILCLIKALEYLPKREVTDKFLADLDDFESKNKKSSAIIRSNA